MTTVRASAGRLLPLLSCLALAVFFGAGAAGTQGTDKTIFVAVLDAENKPVTDMTAADFAVREDGAHIREVVSAKLSTAAPQIAMLVDTSGEAEEYVVDIRNGFRAFAKDVLAKNPDAQLALWEFGQAAVRIRDFTNDAAVLDKDIGRVFPKRKTGSVLLEAIYDVSEALAKRPTQFRSMITLNIEPSDEQSSQQPTRVNESLGKSRAQLWSLSVQKGSLRNAKQDLVLNQLVRNAGGQREYIVTQQAIESYLKRYAQALTTQYEVTYRRPQGRAQIVQTGTTRQGVKVVAGIFAPQ